MIIITWYNFDIFGSLEDVPVYQSPTKLQPTEEYTDVPAHKCVESWSRVVCKLWFNNQYIISTGTFSPQRRVCFAHNITQVRAAIKCHVLNYLLSFQRCEILVNNSRQAGSYAHDVFSNRLQFKKHSTNLGNGLTSIWNIPLTGLTPCVVLVNPALSSRCGNRIDPK